MNRMSGQWYGVVSGAFVERGHGWMEEMRNCGKLQVMNAHQASG